MIHRPTWIAAAAPLLLALVFAGCRGDAPGHSALPPEPEGPHLIHQQGGGPDLLEIGPQSVPGVVMAPVEEADLPGTLETTGQVTFDDRRVSTIVSRVQGRIEETRVSLWDNVSRGERILALYSPDFMTAEAEYLQAQETAKVAPAPGLSGSNDVASALLSSAKRKLELLGMEDVDIATLREASPTVWMRAPISGTVVDNKALRGGAVNPGDELFALGTLEDVWITADIFEDDLARVQIGQQLEAVTTAYPQDVFHGVISRISPSVDPNTHALSIRCEVRNPGGKLKPQMLARVHIVVRPGKVLVVPQDALIFETDSYFAYLDVGGGRLERRKVAIGPWTKEGYARVVSGLKAGDRVVTGETLQVNALWHQARGESS